MDFSAYILILNTLHEFGLITESQKNEKIEECQQTLDEQNAFRERWQANRKTLSWWKRVGTSEHGWVNAWFDEKEKTA